MPDKNVAAHVVAGLRRWQGRDCWPDLTCRNDSSHALLVPLLRDGRAMLECSDCEWEQVVSNKIAAGALELSMFTGNGRCEDCHSRCAEWRASVTESSHTDPLDAPGRVT